MTTRTDTLLLWTPRALGLLVAAFLALFALDAPGDAGSAAHALGDTAAHLLPALALGGVVAASWHRPWLGALAFTSLAAAYAILARARLDWVATIAGPLLVVGAAYLVSWRARERTSPGA